MRVEDEALDGHGELSFFPDIASNSSAAPTGSTFLANSKMSPRCSMFLLAMRMHSLVHPVAVIIGAFAASHVSTGQWPTPGNSGIV